MDVSVVIPVYNEEDNVLILHSQLVETMDKLKLDYELIFIDDGSSDNTYNELEKLKNIKIIKFRRNFGQTAALSAGFNAAKGKIIVSMDGDLQNDPSDIPKLLDKIDEGHDFVSGWRYKRKDSIGKKLFSRLANKLRHMLIADVVHDSGCSLKAYKKECFEEIDLLGEMHRYIPALLNLRGFKVTEVKVNHKARQYGKTKYGIKRLFRGGIDLMNVWFWRKYSARPLHIFGSLGLVFSLLGFFFGFYAIYLRTFRNVDLSSTFLPDIAVFMVIIGIQFFVSGLMTDILIKNYYASNKKKNYSIEKVVEK